jgi:hypothetical protein
VTRQLFQDHLDLRAAREQRASQVVAAVWAFSATQLTLVPKARGHAGLEDRHQRRRLSTIL